MTTLNCVLDARVAFIASYSCVSRLSQKRQRNFILSGRSGRLTPLIDNATLYLSCTRRFNRNVLQSSGRYCCNSSLPSIRLCVDLVRSITNGVSLERHFVAQIWDTADWRERTLFWNVTKVEHSPCYLSYPAKRNGSNRSRTGRKKRDEQKSNSISDHNSQSEMKPWIIRRSLSS